MSSPFLTSSSKNFQWALIGHMLLAIITSLWVPDTTTSIAAIGFVALFISNTQLLWLYVVLAPLSLALDIGQMAYLHGTHGTTVYPLFVILRVVEMLSKSAGGLYGWQICSSGSAVEAGYETMNGPEAQDHFPPAYAPNQPDVNQQGQPPLGPQGMAPGP